LPEFIARPAYEIALRLEMRDGCAWSVVLKPEDISDTALRDFEHELSLHLETPVRILDVTGLSFVDLRQQLHTPPGDVVVLVGLDDWSRDSWTSLDINRDGMAREGPLIFWLSPSGVLGLCRHAPNIRSFVGGSIFPLGPEKGVMSEEERQRRLEQFAGHFQLRNEQVIQMAEAGTLPPEPEFVEWLVLLGRGDLV